MSTENHLPEREYKEGSIEDSPRKARGAESKESLIEDLRTHVRRSFRLKGAFNYENGFLV